MFVITTPTLKIEAKQRQPLKKGQLAADDYGEWCVAAASSGHVCPAAASPTFRPKHGFTSLARSLPPLPCRRLDVFVSVLDPLPMPVTGLIGRSYGSAPRSASADAPPLLGALVFLPEEVAAAAEGTATEDELLEDSLAEDAWPSV